MRTHTVTVTFNVIYTLSQSSKYIASTLRRHFCTLLLYNQLLAAAAASLIIVFSLRSRTTFDFMPASVADTKNFCQILIRANENSDLQTYWLL